jgi:hypothetical protein
MPRQSGERRDKWLRIDKWRSVAVFDEDQPGHVQDAPPVPLADDIEQSLSGSVFF